MADRQVLTPITFNATVTIADATNVALNTTTGTQIGTGTTQKVGFLGATPVAQQASSVDITTVLSNFGLRAAGTIAPISVGSVNCRAISIADGFNVVLGTTTGTMIGNTTSQKLGFFNTTPIVQQANSVDLGAVLSNFGFRVAGGNPPLNLGTGALTAGATSVGTLAATDTITITDAKNIVLATTTGTKIGTGTTQKLGFFNATPVVQQANTTDLATVLTNLGLRASGATAIPLDLGTGALSAGTTTLGTTSFQVGVNSQAGTTYTLALSDANTLVRMAAAGASTLTIPANASVAFPVGTIIYFASAGAGGLTLAITTDTFTGQTAYANGTGGYIIKRAATTWIAFKTA